jgi:hypothetical protein
MKKLLVKKLRNQLTINIVLRSPPAFKYPSSGWYFFKFFPKVSFKLEWTLLTLNKVHAYFITYRLDLLVLKINTLRYATIVITFLKKNVGNIY